MNARAPTAREASSGAVAGLARRLRRARRLGRLGRPSTLTELLPLAIAGGVKLCHELRLATGLVDMFDQGRDIVAIAQERPVLRLHRGRNVLGKRDTRLVELVFECVHLALIALHDQSPAYTLHYYLVRVLYFASFGFLLGVHQRGQKCPPTWRATPKSTSRKKATTPMRSTIRSRSRLFASMWMRAPIRIWPIFRMRS